MLRPVCVTRPALNRSARPSKSNPSADYAKNAVICQTKSVLWSVAVLVEVVVDKDAVYNDFTSVVFVYLQCTLVHFVFIV